MILLLVVAILVLLALLGTAYILMARADKQATYAANSAANIGLAQKAALNIVRNAMLNQTLDGAGNVMANYGYWSSTITYPIGAVVEVAPNFTSTYATTYYECTVNNTITAPPGANWNQITGPRCYDYPQYATYYQSGADSGGLLVWSQNPPYSIYEAVQNDPAIIPATLAPGSTSLPAWQPVQGEPWLVQDLPMEPNTNYVVGQTAIWDTQRYVCLTAGATGPGPIAALPTSPTTWTPASTGTAQENMFSNLTPQTSAGTLAYDPATGAYDLTPYPPTNPAAAASVVQPAVVANATLNPSGAYPYGTRDANWQMLPYSDPNGTRYRFAVRIVDTNSMLNLNAGSAGNIANTSGQYFNGAQLDGLVSTFGSPADVPTYIVNGGTVNSTAIVGRGGGTAGSPVLANTNIAAWAYDLFTYQAPIYSGVQWYSLATELELRSYGGSGGGFNGGTPYYGRPLQLWPNTLGYATTSPYLAAANRDFYTTYSWDRSYRRIVDMSVAGMPTTLNGSITTTSPTGVAGESVWPTFPEKIWGNEPSAASTSANQANTTAKVATDLARDLLSCGYTSTEAVAFAANYLNYMYGQGTESGTSPNFTYTPSANGPSFVDASGICVRGPATANFTGATDLTSALATGLTLPVGLTQADVIVAGYSAQPFIVEAAVNASISGTTVTYNDSAVELYNPYGTALEIGGWEIGILDNTGTIYKTTYTIPTNTAIPANGYLAIESGAATPAFSFEGSPPAAQILTASTATLAFTSTASTACNAVLLRPFVTRAGVAGYLPVDEFDVAAFEAVASAGNYYISRYSTNVPGNQWGCANATETPVESSGPATQPTAPAPATFPAIPLYDRFADQTDSLNTTIAPAGDLPGYAPGTEPAAGATLLNIADFNRITRLISLSAVSGTVYVPVQMISQTIKNLPPVTDPPPPNAASTYLSYEASARFDFLQPSNASPPDPRALDILKMITMTNPASDPDINTNNAILDSIRMGGRINVNTASEAVLAAMFVSAGQNATNAATLASEVIDYRDRESGFGLAGSGIRSMGELLFALTDSTLLTGGNNGTYNNTATTLDSRDWTWATIYNMCAVRSDTFIVYGLIQALHLNGNYNGTLPATANSTDWYTANQGTAIGSSGTQNSISTDPDNTNAEFILEGQRRFMTIIDRSYANAPLGSSTGVIQLPKVVALKNLPN